MKVSNVYILAKRLYDKRIYPIDKVRKLTEIGELTEEEYKLITGQEYESK